METITELQEMTNGKTLAQLQTELEFQQDMGEDLGGAICSHIVYEMEKLRYKESLKEKGHMKKYTFSFTGRQTGAIGIFYKITDVFEAENLSEAKSMLFANYEHFRGIRVQENGKAIDFNSEPFSDTKYSVKLDRK